jgi:anti-sigma regulatory factor (Ser/Thr protein kinase)
MDKMAPTRPTELHERRVRLSREPAAAAEARSQVRAAICAWKVSVDPDIAVLLTSDLVTNAITHGDGKTVTLAIRCSCGHLRIEIYDTSRSLPMAVDEPAVTKTGHGLVLVAALSTEWGSFRTPAGRVVYFTLAFQSDLPRPQEATRGNCEPGTPSASQFPLVAQSGKTPNQ